MARVERALKTDQQPCCFYTEIGHRGEGPTGPGQLLSRTGLLQTLLLAKARPHISRGTSCQIRLLDSHVVAEAALICCSNHGRQQ